MSNSRPKRKTKKPAKYEDSVSDSINKKSIDNSGVIGWENVSGNGDVQESMGSECLSMGNGDSACSSPVEHTVSKGDIENQAKTSVLVESNGVNELNVSNGVVGTKDSDSVEKVDCVQQSNCEQGNENCVNEGTKVVNEVGTSEKKSHADVTANNRSTNEAKLVTIPTELDSNGIEVVVFDEILTAKGSKI